MLVLSVGTARATVIVNGTDTGSNSYTVKDSTDTAAVFTGTGTIIQTGSGASPARYTGSFTGFSGLLQLTRTTGEFWFLNSKNLVKGDGNDLEMNIAANNATLVFNDADADNPISFHFSVLNGPGNIRTSNGTQVAACTLVLGTDTAGYDGTKGHNFSGKIIKCNLSGGGQSYFNLKKVGTNTQTLSGDNTGLAGRIDVEGGMLVSNTSKSLGTAHVYVSSGASLYFNDPQTVANAIDFAGTGVGNNTAALRVYGNITFSGNLTLTANSTIYVDKNKTSKITNELAGGSNAYTLTKTGSGFLTIATQADKNSINGVVIQGGLLEAASANALGGATSGNHVKLAGGTLRLSTAVGEITFDTTGTPKGAISVNNTSTTQSWDLTNYLATKDIDFVKIGAGTVRMTGNYSDKALKSAEIRAGRIQIYGSTAEEARVFPVGANVQVKQG
ncbi:MAG: hypothetical protein IJK97_03090, partial [Thermoguttaceae bacterium]|nr:hypothetical protein [Thermoguttaceae bacterium]